MGVLDERIYLPAVLDIELGAARRPRHGEFDVAFATALVQRATQEEDAALELRRHVHAALDAILPAERSEAVQKLLVRLDPFNDGEDGAEAAIVALELGDALCEALGIDQAATSDVIGASGLVRGQCRDLLIGQDDEVLRERFPNEERPAACYLACPEGHCARRTRAAPALERAVRDWRLCGGARRSCLPRAGGLEDQDAGTLFWFQQLDEAARPRGATREA